MNTLFERNITNYKDEWITPPSLIKSLGEFDLDPCSPIIRPWPTAKNHFTIEDDGLQKKWFGRVWCNPPYSNIEEWLKMCAAYSNVIALTFARTDTKMFMKHVFNVADSIFFIQQRVKFCTVQGIKTGGGGAPSCFIAYGSNNVEALDECKIPGKHVLLNHRSIIVVGVSPTWFTIVKIAVKHFGDEELKPLYDMVERMAPDKIERNQHWKAKIRQQLYELRKKAA